MLDFIELGLDMKHIVAMRSVSEIVVFSECNAVVELAVNNGSGNNGSCFGK